MSTIKPRWFQRNLQAALRVLPVSVVTGARQTGKTTLAQMLAPARAHFTLDRSMRRKASLVRGVVLHAGKARPLDRDDVALPWGWMVPGTS